MLRFMFLKKEIIPVWLWQLSLILIVTLFTYTTAYGAQLINDSLIINNSLPSAATTYKLQFTLTNNETIGSIDVEFCSNTPIVTFACTAPNGFSLTNSSLINQTGISGFTVSNTSNAYNLLLTRSPAQAIAEPVSFTFTNVINPSSQGSYYVRIQTYSTSDGTGSSLDIGGIAFSINSALSISTYVPPYLLFCAADNISSYSCSSATGNYINFGDLSAKATASAESKVLIATNAKNGYTILVSGSPMTSGNNVLPALNSTTSALPGNSQFGINLVANSSPSVGANVQGPGTGSPTSSYSIPNLFKYLSGDVIASSPQVSSYKEYTISYIINISNQQPPGFYSTTLTYVATGNF